MWNLFAMPRLTLLKINKNCVSLGIDDAQGLLMKVGFRKPLCKLELADKPDIRRVLLDYHLMMKVKMHVDQLADGLKQLKVLDAI